MPNDTQGVGDLQNLLAGNGTTLQNLALKRAITPRLTTTARNAIATNTLVAGDEIYNTTTNKKNFWNGSAWEVVTSA